MPQYATAEHESSDVRGVAVAQDSGALATDRVAYSLSLHMPTHLLRPLRVCVFLSFVTVFFHGCTDNVRLSLIRMHREAWLQHCQ